MVKSRRPCLLGLDLQQQKFRWAPGHTGPPPCTVVARAISQGLSNRGVRLTNPFSPGIKNEWGYTSTPSIRSWYVLLPTPTPAIWRYLRLAPIKVWEKKLFTMPHFGLPLPLISIYLSGLVTAVAVFRNPNTIHFCLTTDLLLNVLFSWLLVHLPSTFFLDVL